MYLYALYGTNPNSLQISYDRTEEFHSKYSWHLKLAGAQREQGLLYRYTEINRSEEVDLGLWEAT